MSKALILAGVAAAAAAAVAAQLPELRRYMKIKRM
jgi:hypothetical protein